MSGCRILNRQYLHQPEITFHRPIDQPFQVGKLPHPHRFAAAEAEDGDGHPGAPPACIRQMYKAVMQNADLMLAGIPRKASIAGARLVPDECPVFFVVDPVLIIDGKGFRRHLDIGRPPGAFRRQQQRVLLIPVMQRGAAAQQANDLVFLQ